MLRIPEQPESGPFARFLRTIPLPRGECWYLVLYRWFLVVVCLYTVAVQWNLWDDRSDPNWHAATIGTPTNTNLPGWTERPSDAKLAPMLPVWDGMSQVPLGWPLVVSLLLVLVRPRAGLIATGLLIGLGILMDRTRIQPHYMMVLLMVGTLPSLDARLVGRTALIALWFWAGFHKFLIDFIKPDGMYGFAQNIIPMDLARFFPPETYAWNTAWVGVALGWAVATTEMMLGLLSLIPRLRIVVAGMALMVHAGIVYWNCWQLRSNLLGWNLALSLAGLALILPWREWPWVSWKQCRWPARVASIFLLVYPAGYYCNWVNAYFSYCVYVPNSPFTILHRPGEGSLLANMMPYDMVNAVLPPGHSVINAYFEKIRQPGDVMVIHDPRPWAQSRGYNGRQLTDLGPFLKTGKHWIYRYPDGATSLEGFENDFGEKEGLWTSWHRNGMIEGRGLYLNGKRQGRWIFYYNNGKKQSAGDYEQDVQEGPWTTWYEDGKKETEGNFTNGQMDGLWKEWTEDGAEDEMEFRAGLPIGP